MNIRNRARYVLSPGERKQVRAGVKTNFFVGVERPEARPVSRYAHKST
jgi:hypothetical protein